MCVNGFTTLKSIQIWNEYDTNQSQMYKDE